MTDETKQAASGGVVETAVDGVETAVKGTVAETVKAVDGAENAVVSGAANDEDKVEAFVDSRESALTQAKVSLLQKVEALLHKAGAEIADDADALKAWLKAEVARL